MLIFGKEIFLDRVLKLLHHERRMRKSCLWLPAALGWLFLAKRLESREFPQGEHPLLCKRKLNYVIMRPSCFGHEMNVHLSFAEELFLNMYFKALSKTLPCNLYRYNVFNTALRVAYKFCLRRVI